MTTQAQEAQAPYMERVFSAVMRWHGGQEQLHHLARLYNVEPLDILDGDDTLRGD